MASDCCVGAAFSADLAGAYVHSLTVRNYCYAVAAAATAAADAQVMRESATLALSWIRSNCQNICTALNLPDPRQVSVDYSLCS
jgi:hypothetical protein